MKKNDRDESNYDIHSTSEVNTKNIGKRSIIWQFCVVLSGAKIGENVSIGSHTFIENDVVIGNNVTIKNGNYLFDGLIIEDNVFIGPNVTFTNDKYPRAKIIPSMFPKTIVKFGASIGGGAVVLPGVTIGENSLIGAGSIVAEDVPPNVVYRGQKGQIKKTRNL